MLNIGKSQLIRYLLAYGEVALSSRIALISSDQYDQICEVGYRYALTGIMLYRAACLAAVEVLEGKPRELRRKRAVWTNVPDAEPNPGLDAVSKRFEAYSDGRPLKKPDVLAGMSEAVSRVLPRFRYFKSHAQFRMQFASGTAYVQMDYTSGCLQLHFGIQHRQVEEHRASLFDGNWKPSRDKLATIFFASQYLGPNSPRWRYPTEGWWPISGSQGLERASDEIAHFISEIVLPYLRLHQEPLAIRETLLLAPERSLHSGLWHEGSTVFAIDHLLRQRRWLQGDYYRLRQRFESLALEQLEHDYELANKNWEAASA